MLPVGWPNTVDQKFGCLAAAIVALTVALVTPSLTQKTVTSEKSEITQEPISCTSQNMFKDVVMICMACSTVVLVFLLRRDLRGNIMITTNQQLAGPGGAPVPVVDIPPDTAFWVPKSRSHVHRNPDCQGLKQIKEPVVKAKMCSHCSGACG